MAVGSEAHRPVEAGSGVRVRPLSPDDLAWTGPLQREALPHGFFTRLGPSFLRAYQRTFVDSPFGVALAAESGGPDGGEAGFVLGAVDATAHRAWVLRNRRGRLLLFGAGCLLAHPRVLGRFCRTRLLHYGRALARRIRRVPRAPRPGTTAVLTHVAVAPESRRSGAGRLLVEAFLDEARSHGSRRARLTTLEDDRGAYGFWRSLGWRPGEVVEDDDRRAHRVFQLDL